MTAVVQRIAHGRVSVNGETVSAVRRGLLVYAGVSKGDTETDCEYLARKIANLRIFMDDQGKMNLSALQIGGEILLISQFTLCADTRKGNRPSFNQALAPENAEKLLEKVRGLLSDMGLSVKTGVFGAHMMVEYVNDGPVTILLESHAVN
jgi:D-tyrosyl-tRNA(Tyr) deacylase